MIDYLCRIGLVVPTETGRRGRGNPRKFSFGDIVMLRTLKTLMERGVSPSRLNDAIAKLRARYPEITPDKLPARFLVTDGQRAIFKDEERGIFEDLNSDGQLLFSFVVDLEPFHRHVRTELVRRGIL